jgi:hypothetical protein
MTTAFLSAPERQQKLEWLNGGTFRVLLEAAELVGCVIGGPPR